MRASFSDVQINGAKRRRKVFMTDLNNVCLVGRVVKDPELVQDSSGLSRLPFSIAVNRDKKAKDSDEWIQTVTYVDMTLFGKRAEGLHKWLKKGKSVSVVAHLSQNTWEKDGQKRSELRVVPDQVNPFIEREPKDAPSPAEAAAAAAPAVSDEEVF